MLNISHRQKLWGRQICSFFFCLDIATITEVPSTQQQYCFRFREMLLYQFLAAEIWRHFSQWQYLKQLSLVLAEVDCACMRTSLPTIGEFDVKIDFSWLTQRTLLKENVLLRDGRIPTEGPCRLEPQNWYVRDLHSTSCPTSPPKQSCWQHELMPALALSTSLWRPPEYSFYHLSGQPLPVLHYLPQGKRSEASRNLPSCSFYFDPCSLCCWEEFGSILGVPWAGSRLFCTHSSDPLDLFSRAALWSQFVLIYGVILAQVCVIFYFLWVPFCW